MCRTPPDSNVGRQRGCDSHQRQDAGIHWWGAYKRFCNSLYMRVALSVAENSVNFYIQYPVRRLTETPNDQLKTCLARRALLNANWRSDVCLSKL